MTVADPVRGALLMVAFWMGTVPILVTVSGITSLGLTRLNSQLRAVVGCLFIVLGALMLQPKHHHNHNSHEGKEGMQEKMENSQPNHKHH
jgi:sulfite exporter TauE/SafE